MSQGTVASTDVTIVGGGPVGLFLGCRLAQLGVEVKLLETRTDPHCHSRSIGIHPPSLEKLAEIGVARRVVERGVKVGGGYAFANKTCLGYLSLETCPKPYTFVLALPQHETERILETHLHELAPGSLLRGVTVTDLKQTSKGVTVNTSQGIFSSKFVVGCDGKDSAVRSLAAIDFRGHTYPDTYVMGDFADTTDLGTNAGIYLTDNGLVESFPLPNGVRRWVAKTDAYVSTPSADHLSQLVQARLGLELPVATNTMLSSFGVQHYLASHFAKGRVFLAGDAAHIVSPIGGQGMNLGWLDAWTLATQLRSLLSQNISLDKTANAYNLERQRATKIAAQRAEINMMLGRKMRLAQVKYGAVSGLLQTPLKRLFARLFTMRWL